MKTHTQAFKDNIKLFGRQIDSKIIYGNTELGSEELNSITPHYEGGILKSVMKQLDIDSNVNIPLETNLEYQFGLKINNQYEYISFGNYIVYNVEKQEDTNSYKITCYDKILKAMVPYENMNLVYPITIKNYISAICTHLGITFANATDTFVNYDKEIPYELYLDANGNDLGFTFRDVLDELAQATASTICINNNDELEIRYVSKEKGLPNGYIQLEYISSSKTQYIDTGINADSKLRVVLDMAYIDTTATNNSAMIGAIYNNNGSYVRYHLGINNTTNYRNYFANGSKDISGVNTNRHIFDFDAPNKVFKVDETSSASYTYTNFDTQLNYWLFGRNSNDSNLKSYNATKLYNAKLYYEGTLVRDFKPCYRASDRKVGLYDIVNNVFYENQGTGTFSYGKEITDTIDEEYLKDVNVKFGEKYGPINSIVLSRSAESDNIYQRDENSITQNGLCELKISENQIMNFDNRDEYLQEIFNKLNGLEYYINDYKSTGVCYLDVCDRYNVIIGQNTYSCVMFNDEVLVTQGLEENIYTEMPDESKTDYTKADKTDRKINQAISMVDKQNLTITNLVSETTQAQELNNERILELIETTNSVQQQITATNQTIEVMQRDIIDGKESLKNNLVTIDINGINVSTSSSAISTLMTNEKFVIKSGETTLAYFGYDVDTNSTKAEMDNLTITNYLTAGYHRREKFDVNNEHRTGEFYIGG